MYKIVYSCIAVPIVVYVRKEKRQSKPFREHHVLCVYVYTYIYYIKFMHKRRLGFALNRQQTLRTNKRALGYT